MSVVDRIRKARKAINAAAGVVEAAIESGGTVEDLTPVLNTLNHVIEELQRAEEEAGQSAPDSS